MVMEAGAVVGYLIAWAVRVARRATERVEASAEEAADSAVETAVEVGLTRLHDLVAAKLGRHPALDDLRDEAGELARGGRGEVTDLTRQQVQLALMAAAAKDEGFARAVGEVLVRVRAAETAAGTAELAGPGSTVFVGDAQADADHGAIAIGQAGSVAIGLPSQRPEPPSAGAADAKGTTDDPPSPGRSGR